MNIANAQPTVCLNDVIDQQSPTLNLTRFSLEEFIGRTVAYLEQWVSQLSQANILHANTAINTFYRFYESHWMHQ